MTTFAPIWILTGLGYAARRTGLIGANAALDMSRFVYYVAMPAALFLTLSRTPTTDPAVRPLLAFAGSTVVVMGLASIAAVMFERNPGEAAIWGMSAGYVNSASLGLPIALQVLGDVSLLVEVVLFQVLVVTPLLLLALDRQSDKDGRLRLHRIATLPVRNPVILASGLGVAASFSGLRPPPMLDASLILLSGAAIPLALISLGASLHADRPMRRS